MDVFSIGAGAPKAPENRGGTRGADAKRTPDRVQVGGGADAIASSGDGATVAAFVQKVASASDVRQDVVVSFRQLLGRGVLETADAVDRAAAALLGN